jgi:hypothetical protein
MNAAWKQLVVKHSAHAFIIAILLIPLFSLFWTFNVGGIKANWFPLIPGFISCILLVTFFKRKSFFFAALAAGLFLTIFFIRNQSIEPVLRITISLLPLGIFAVIRQNNRFGPTLFFSAYCVILILPLTISALQLLGHFPFYDVGPSYRFLPDGRISGGYMKPNNLCAYFFPLYLFGFHLLFSGKRKLGSVIIAVCLIVVTTSALRTAMIPYFVILLASFFITVFNKYIHYYYRFFFPFVAGVVSFFIIYLLFQLDGPVQGLRYRLPMWQAHADHYFSSDLLTVMVGFGDTALPDYYKGFEEIRSFNEVHNNTFRILISFGLFGFFLYCLLLRNVVLGIHQIWQYNPHRLFLANACVLYYLVYSITNEPAFYTSITWTVMLWLFLNGIKNETSTC